METIGKYEILDKIGSGGFAIVYKGYDPFIKRPVAIKVCFSRDEATRRRFYREAEIAGRLVHRNITTVYDFGLHEDMPYLVEEYLSGEDLAHLIRRREPDHLDEKLAYLRQVGDGLGFAHSQGVIHRDIKPSNVRVLDSGRVKIMDFGTAKLAGADSNLTQTGMTMGTIAYLAPERLRGKTATPASDLFSFGVMAYEMIAFARPFHDTNIPALIDRVLTEPPEALIARAPDCPPALATVIERCLVKDPEERWRSCAELLDALGQAHSARVSPTQEATRETSAGEADLLAGLLDRARRNVHQKRYARARVLLEEALEIDPRSVEATSLMSRCDEAPLPSGSGQSTNAPLVIPPPPDAPPPAPTTDDVATATEPPAHSASIDERRAEGVRSIERLLDDGRLAAAADALRFAVHLFGDLGTEASRLRGAAAGAIRQQVTDVRGQGQRQAKRVTQTLGRLLEADLLSRDMAEHFAERAEEVAPGHTEARALLRRLESRTSSAGDVDRDRQRAEAISSIERLLADGRPELAEEALRFALRLCGAFDEAKPLRRQIEQALGRGPVEVGHESA